VKSHPDLGRRALLLAALAAPAGGCALLSSPDPVQLYRFGQSAAPAAAPAAQAAVTILYTGTSLPRAAGNDRILTTSGPEVSYIGGARWSSSAVVLFEEAVVRAFHGSPVRLVRRGGASRADATLRVEVRTFEARYSGPEIPPTVVVEARALLTPSAAGAALIDRDFAAQSVAGQNRVSVIAQAYDAAVSDVVGQVVAWTAATARAVA
jgi:cholesterol transport system auxiliary component